LLQTALERVAELIAENLRCYAAGRLLKDVQLLADAGSISSFVRVHDA
jgi:hypothetical protein